ncbi:hypothetical protein ADA01nite_38420 [Aneurinibacillus danicus]|uniref:Uncharacterized protein n=1 Tax=Aneurinibacillus danicus TaxID=267746 RepID=A0A511VGN3_9BACL|nr:hypothetical protein ADA01nite_38420 [Aneurinibacillus danicus]
MVAEQKKLVKSISVETIRVILEEANITYPHTKTWKESNDPDFAAKKNESSNSITNHQKKGG